MDFFAGIWLSILGIFGMVPELQVVEEDMFTQTELIQAQVQEVVEEEEIVVPEKVSPPTKLGSDPESEPRQDPVEVSLNLQTILVAGGCFWCVEADLEKTPGVVSAVSGYAGGSTSNPTYQNYGSGGHREVVEVTYSADQISFEDVLIVTLKTTDPTDDDGTFGDRGDKYSAAFYYETEEQKQTIIDLIAEVDKNGPYEKKLEIDIEQRPTFWPAEDFHQDYYKGTVSKLKYQLYRAASGRSDFIKKHWGEDKSPALPWRTEKEVTKEESEIKSNTMNETETKPTYSWTNYEKPEKEVLKEILDPIVFNVTQNDGTERAGTSPLDKVYERGIYVDILSGEPLYSSRDKFDSGTGWPSFTRPISEDALTLHEDRKLFSVRTETRSTIADNHIGHVFDDGPVDQGGLRYCMNGVALRFVPEVDMVAEGYEDFLTEL